MKPINVRIEKGIAFIDYPPLSMDLETAKETVRIRKSEFANKSYPCVGDVTNIRSVTKEAREYLAAPECTEGVTAAAIIYGNIISSTLVNIFLRLNPSGIPVRVFSDRNKAEAWIQKYKS